MSSLIRDRRTDRLCSPDPAALADAVLELAGSRRLRDRLARHALNAALARSWESALAELAAGYARALGPAEALTAEGGPGLRTEGAQPPALRRAA